MIAPTVATWRATFETSQGFPIHVLLPAPPGATVAELYDRAKFAARARGLSPQRCVAMVRWPLTAGTRRALMRP